MSDQALNRRQFGKRAAATTAVLGTGLISQGDAAIRATAEEHEPAIAEPIPPESIPVDLLLLAVIRQMHPDRKLTHHYLAEIRRDIASELRRARAIRAVPLQNANEPAALFAAYRSGE